MSSDDDDRENSSIWRDWRRQIREDLDAHRPARYDQGELDWMAPVIARARGRMPIDDAVVIRRHVEREVRNEEGLANKRGNKQAREWFEGKQPLLWSLLGPCPIIVGTTRIRSDVATPDEVLEANVQSHADNLTTFNRAELAIAAYDELRKRAAGHGYEQLSLLGDLPPRGQDDDMQTDQTQAI
jgi:hypothetical protein